MLKEIVCSDCKAAKALKLSVKANKYSNKSLLLDSLVDFCMNEFTWKEHYRFIYRTLFYIDPQIIHDTNVLN